MDTAGKPSRIIEIETRRYEQFGERVRCKATSATPKVVLYDSISAPQLSTLLAASMTP